MEKRRYTPHSDDPIRNRQKIKIAYPAPGYHDPCYRAHSVFQTPNYSLQSLLQKNNYH